MGMIHELIPKVMADIGAVKKNGRNAFDNYNFRGIDDVYLAVQPALIKHQITIVPNILETTQTRYTTAKGTPMLHTFIRVSYEAFAPDGSSIVASTVGEASDRSDKSANKAMSASYKYFFFQVLCIPTQEPKDSESDSPDIPFDVDFGGNTSSKPKVKKDSKRVRLIKICSDGLAKLTISERKDIMGANGGEPLANLNDDELERVSNALTLFSANNPTDDGDDDDFI